MLLPFVLLLFHSVESTIEAPNCLDNIKCFPTTVRYCVRIKQSNKNTTSNLLLNKCELQSMECKKGMKASIIPLKNCILRNRRFDLTRKKKLSTAGVLDDKHRKLGFLIDLSSNSDTQLPLIINAIKRVADEAVIFNKPTFILYTLPEYTNYEPTNDINVFKTNLDQLKAVPMESCEKKIFGVMREVCYESDWDGNMDHSYLYVFTNGLETLPRLHFILIETCKTKQIKVTFILMPGCYDRKVRSNEKFERFFDVAAGRQGQLIRIRNAENVKLEFPKYVKHTALEFDPVVVLSGMEGHDAYLPFEVPENVTFALVSVAGSNIDCAITDYWANKVVQEMVYNSAHTKVYRFVALPPHSYAVKLDTSVYEFGNKTVVVNLQFSKVDFAFRYRFSKRQKWRERIDINDIGGEGGEDVIEKDKKAKYLIIHVSEERQLVDVNRIKFMDKYEDGHDEIFESHALIKIDENIYATEYKIGVPDHEFIMVASGILKGSTKEVDARILHYKPSDQQNEKSSEESQDSEETSVSPTDLITVETTTETTKTTITFPSTTCSMHPEALKLTNLWTNLDMLQWKQYRSSCPEQCPVRDVMVCARCQHGVSRTFMSDCHMRMYQCQYPEDKLHLLARKPCVGSAPFLGDFPRPVASLGEPNDHDPVMSHIDAMRAG